MAELAYNNQDGITRAIDLTPIRPETQIRQIGPWNQELTASLLAGPPALPMPVKIAEPKTLVPIFRHLEMNGNSSPLPEELEALARGEMKLLQARESNYNVPFIEYEKGVIYADRRLDLCKMVLGPCSIEALLDSLEKNDFIRHFLLGNNIIGPVGATRIARFIRDHPDRMKTWYLAGNCIDATGFCDIVRGLVASIATNVWLKRNPLMVDSVESIVHLICHSHHLRTLDLAQTELTDAGVKRLFDNLLTSSVQEHTLQHIYLNGNGIGIHGATSISRYLSSTLCNLKSLFLSDNPLGDIGVAYLAEALKTSHTIERLMLPSVGITAQGAAKLLRCLSGHETLMSLDIGQSFATKDLGTRINWITDDALPALKRFVQLNVSTQYLNLGITSLSPAGINEVLSVAIENNTICCFALETIQPTPVQQTCLLAKKLRRDLNKTLILNVAKLYDGINILEFEAKFKRGLTGPQDDVRKTDSIYRNRDAGLAKRGLKILDKWWKEDDTTLQEVMDWRVDVRIPDYRTGHQN